MSAFRILAAPLTLTLITLLTSGCVSTTSSGNVAKGAPASVETSTPPPARVSDEEVLAEAMAALDHYDEQWSQLWSDPSVDVSILKPLVTADRFDAEVTGVQNLRQSGKHLEGRASRLDEQIIDKDETEVRSVLVCYDLSDVHQFDDAGNDITPEGRDKVVPVLASFIRSDGRLLISHRVDWKGSDPCGQ